MRLLGFALVLACSTKPPPVVRLALIGDTGTAEQPQYDVGTDLSSVCAAGGCDAVLMLGDNFYPNGVGSTDDPQWDTAFAKPYAGLEAPLFAALGNHDYGGNGLGYDKARAQAQLDKGAGDGAFRMPARYY